MDVGLYHHSNEFPAWVAPLLAALEGYGADRHTPDGTVMFCPDAATCAPPANTAALVGFVPATAGVTTRDQAVALRSALLPWVERGALFLAATPPAAQLIRDLLGLSADRVRVISLPAPNLPPRAEGIPEADTILALPGTDPATLFGAARAVRLGGRQLRLIVAGPEAEGWTRPGGTAGLHELLPGHDAVHVENWRSAVDRAAVIVVGASADDLGCEVREALATGRPVIVPATPVHDAHLNAAGAAALRYVPGDPVSLGAALVEALRAERASMLAVEAADAVVRETAAAAAETLFDTLCRAVEPATNAGAAQPAPSAGSAGEPADVGDRLRVLFLSPLPAFGGHATIIRSFIQRLCQDPRRPIVTVVAAADAGPEGGLIQEVLSSAEVARARVVPMHLVDQALAEEVDAVDVVYSVWPHSLEPPRVPVPLVTTFYDMNWRHFDHLSEEENRRLDEQTPRWLSSARIVCSSEFVAGELATHFDADPAQIPIIPVPAPTMLPAPPTADSEHVRRRFALPPRFLLCPAGNHPSKNYGALFAACRELRRGGSPVSVVATGIRTERFVGPDVLGLGYVDATALRALLELSAGVVQPTLYEAGSFPMLEALSCGRAAAVSDIPAITEQVQRWDLRVETFDARDPVSCARAMRAVVEGARDSDAEHNERAVGQYTWGDFAARYLDVMYAVTRASAPRPRAQ